jgi:hypothetical protein
MAEVTISYAPKNSGWTSFHSYIPEWMIGMNSHFYTFFRGNIYKHYSNATRNNYYGDELGGAGQYSSKITPVINDDPTSNKMFKTIALDGNAAWDATITTNQSTGFMDATYFTLKEGDYYTYIRRVAGNTDLDLMSAQGIGEVTTVTGTSPGSIDFTFAFDIGSIISVGDVLYRDNAGIQLIGTITALTSTVVTVAVTAITPVAGNFILYIKNAEAESYGARGYYMEVELENDSTSEVELFTVSSEVFKSFP